MEYVWYDIQYTSMHGTVYKYIQSHTEARWCDGGLCSYAICRHASWLLKGFHKPILLVILKVCAIQECAIKLHIDMQAQAKGTD